MDLSSFKNKKILMTGGTGFVGKNLKEVAKNNELKVTLIGSADCDLKNTEQVKYLFEDEFAGKKFDYIFHGAAMQGAGDFTLKHPAEQIHINSLIHINLLEAWRLYQPQAKFIGMGSTCSYPGNLSVLKESDYLTGKLHDSVQYYGMTKMLMQQGIEAYKTQYGLSGTTVVFATLFGKYDDVDPNRSHVVTALVKKFCDAKKENLPEVEVWGDGSQTRELIYVDDQIYGVFLVADGNDPIINIGTGVETSIKNLAELIKELSGFKGKIAYNINRFVGVKNKVQDISYAKKKYGWTTTQKIHKLEDALSKTIEWYNTI